MRKVFMLLTVSFFSVIVISQVPQRISYQAVVRNSSGALIINASVGMRISLLEGSSSGSSLYVERHTPLSNANGLVTIEVGGGTVVSGSFSAIDWSSGTFFIKSEIDPDGGSNYTITGTSQILSVPYALYAKTAQTSDFNNLVNPPDLSIYLTTESDPLFSASPAQGISTGNINNWNTAYGWGNHASAGYLETFTETDPLWTAARGNYFTKANMQTSGAANLHFDNLTNKPTTLSGYGITDADGSITNEIQELSLSGTTLTLSKDGGSVTLPAGSSGWLLTGNAGTADGTNFIGTTDNVPFAIKVNNQPAGKIDHLMQNTSLGYLALGSNAGGVNNTATGFWALFRNTTGYDNTAYGLYTLSNNTTGYFNTAFGSYALGANTTGSENTATGRYALITNTTGYGNTATGSQALYSNTTGHNNTAIGLQALFQNMGGVANTAIGSESLKNNTIGIQNTASGFGSLRYSQTGSWNAVNGSLAMEINTSGSWNVANGSMSLNANSSGNYNTASGYKALYSNTIGHFNVAVGAFALYNNTNRSHLVAIGDSALFNNGVGAPNYYNAAQNTAVGSKALFSNTTGYENIATGNYALCSNTTGYENTVSGYQTMYSSTTGYSDVAFGHMALYALTTGDKNTGIGCDAGSTVTTGRNLTLIGYNAQPSAVDSWNQVTLGDGWVSSLRCNVQNISSLSDARDKRNITELSLGLDFIMKIKPRQFNWDRREWYANKLSDGSKMKQAPNAGFIAQELDEVQKGANAEWLNLVLKDNPDKLEATPGNLLPVLVKAIQEQQLQIEDLKKEIMLLKSK